MARSSGITVVPAGTALPAALPALSAAGLGNVVPIMLGAALLWIDYTRNAGSAAGVPRLAIDLSRDPSSTVPGSVAHWAEYIYDDGSGFTSAANTTTYLEFGLVLTGANWLRVRMTDVDAVNRGTVCVVLTGAIQE